MAKKFTGTLADIASAENLLDAWREFERGKRAKRDVQEFSFRLMDNILALHRDLMDGSYRHGGYRAFSISDPKPRNIHKASVRDRLVHHATYRILYPFFDRRFIADSYSCRIGKGTHKALNRFRAFAYRVSRNHTRTCWVLKCDIRKFFASIDHGVLIGILERHIADPDVLDLLRRVVESFHASPCAMMHHSAGGGSAACCCPGLPLGNLTSQLLVNIYMNEFDQFAKRRLKARHYIRYADDLIILSHDRPWLERLIPRISGFLSEHVRLTLHPDKLHIGMLASGIDFLGWVHFPDHRVLRTATKRRMLKRIEKSLTKPMTASYVGLLQHGNTEKLRACVSRYVELRFPNEVLWTRHDRRPVVAEGTG